MFSCKPLPKVRIVSERSTMMTSRPDGKWGPEQPITLWKAYQYAIINGTEQLDKRLEVMFDLDENKLRQRCIRHGLRIVN